MPEIQFFEDFDERGKKQKFSALSWYNKKGDAAIEMPADMGKWLSKTLSDMSIHKGNMMNFSDFKASFEKSDLNNFDAFMDSALFSKLREWGLLVL
jgi:hypothetical protein